MDDFLQHEDETAPKRLAKLRWTLRTNKGESEAARKEIMEMIQKYKMAPLLRSLVKEFGWMEDDETVAAYDKANQEALDALNAEEEDADKNFGTAEKSACYFKRVKLYNAIGDTEQELKLLDAPPKVSIAALLDVSLAKMRIGILNDQPDVTKAAFTKASEDVARGGDWERRNKLRVYEAMHFMLAGKFRKALPLLMEAVSTFTCTELLDFPQFIFYTSVVALVCGGRPALHKLVKSPEVRTVCADDPHLKSIIEALHEFDYRLFMRSLLLIGERVQQDMYIGRHFRYVIRQIRQNAYHQYLAPYSSVRVEVMASVFGVSTSFIEDEIVQAISSGVLSMKIDRVGGVIESYSPDKRNSMYLDIIKAGDIVLEKVQKLSRVVAL